MADCQWLLAGQTENQIMLLGQHKCHHPQEAFPASYPDPTTSPDCISPPRSHGPGAFPAHLRANVTSDDLAAGTVRRHHIDLPSLPGSAPQFLSLSFFNWPQAAQSIDPVLRLSLGTIWQPSLHAPVTWLYPKKPPGNPESQKNIQ